MGKLIGWIVTLAGDVLVGMGVQRLVSSVVGVEAPWWAWTLIISIMWRVYALLRYLETIDGANAARFETLFNALGTVQIQLRSQLESIGSQYEKKEEESPQPARTPDRPAITGRSPEVDQWNAETKQIQEATKKKTCATCGASIKQDASRCRECLSPV